MNVDPNYPYGVPASSSAPVGALAAALERSTTWAARDAEQATAQGSRTDHAPFYPRYGHPNARRFEAHVARLERQAGAVSFASGMAAVHAVFAAACGKGDRVLIADQVYGGTDSLARLDLPRFGVEVDRFDALDLDSLARALERPAKLCWVENPVNPTVRLLDLEGIAKLCRAASVVTACDATLAPPPLQRVGDFGIDLAVHSATKSYGGHSDVLAGVVAGPHELLGPLEAFRARSGGVLGPDAAWLLERSMATLELRLAAQCAAAAEFAAALAADAGPDRAVRQVLHPSLPSHPDSERARRTMPSGSGPLLSIEVAGGLAGARHVHDGLRVAARAPSLGGVETLVSLPVLSSHPNVDPAIRQRIGVADGLVRVSIGLEPVEELLADFRAALAGLPGGG